MFSLLYNACLILLALFSLPKLFLRKYRSSLQARLGLSLPAFTPKVGQQIFWIHAVSVGETKAVIPFFRLLRASFPNAAIVLSATTETGLAEAKRSMPEADSHFLLPFDFSWTIRKFVRRIKPTMLILCESDFWYHLLKIGKENGAQTVLINGKVSERSCDRFRKVSFFTKPLFALIDLLCVQSKEYADRFLSMGISQEKIHITGNLKLDAPPQKATIAALQSLKDAFGIQEGDRILVIGSTHSPEEEGILAALQPLWSQFPRLKVILVPRHPERFGEVAHLLQERGLAFHRFSERRKGGSKLILVDKMGLLNECYQIADLAIVGGSFASRVGGHNIFEPVLQGVPVLFGPYMQNQSSLKEMVLTAQTGQQVPLHELAETLSLFLTDATLREKYSQACRTLATSVQGAAKETFQRIFPNL